MGRGARAGGRRGRREDRIGKGGAPERDEADDGRAVLAAGMTRGGDGLAVHDPESRGWRASGDEPGHAARVRARQHLRGYACTPDHDPPSETHVDARWGEVFRRRGHAEGQLADRVGSVRGGARDAPGVALDGHAGFIRARYRPIERRPYDPTTDDRREIDVAIRVQVKPPAVDRR